MQDANWKPGGLNPYSIGIRIERLATGGGRECVGLNPYSIGIRIEHSFTSVF